MTSSKAADGKDPAGLGGPVEDEQAAAATCRLPAIVGAELKEHLGQGGNR